MVGYLVAEKLFRLGGGVAAGLWKKRKGLTVIRLRILDWVFDKADTTLIAKPRHDALGVLRNGDTPLWNVQFRNGRDL